jgi:hypothetical protein
LKKGVHIMADHNEVHSIEFSGIDLSAGVTGGTTRKQWQAFLEWRQGFNPQSPMTRVRTARGIMISQRREHMLTTHPRMGMGYENWKSMKAGGVA